MATHTEQAPTLNNPFEEAADHELLYPDKLTMSRVFTRKH